MCSQAPGQVLDACGTAWSHEDKSQLVALVEVKVGVRGCAELRWYAGCGDWLVGDGFTTAAQPVSEIRSTLPVQPGWCQCKRRAGVQQHGGATATTAGAPDAA